MAPRPLPINNTLTPEQFATVGRGVVAIAAISAAEEHIHRVVEEYIHRDDQGRVADRSVLEAHMANAVRNLEIAIQRANDFAEAIVVTPAPRASTEEVARVERGRKTFAAAKALEAKP